MRWLQPPCCAKPERRSSPAGITDLNTGLANVDADNLSHFDRVVDGTLVQKRQAAKTRQSQTLEQVKDGKMMKFPSRESNEEEHPTVKFQRKDMKECYRGQWGLPRGRCNTPCVGVARAAAVCTVNRAIYKQTPQSVQNAFTCGFMLNIIFNATRGSRILSPELPRTSFSTSFLPYPRRPTDPPPQYGARHLVFFVSTLLCSYQGLSCSQRTRMEVRAAVFPFQEGVSPGRSQPGWHSVALMNLCAVGCFCSAA